MLKLLMAGFVVLGLATAGAAQESQAAKTTRQKLKQKISVEFKDIRTADIFKDIESEMDKPAKFKVDTTTGMSLNTKYSYKAKDKAVETILNELSEKMECGWIVVSSVGNNKVDGWVIIRKSSKGKERGFEAGKDPK